MSVESIESDDKLFEQFCVRRPPELDSREAKAYSPPDTGRAGQARRVEARRGGFVHRLRCACAWFASRMGCSTTCVGRRASRDYRH